MERWLTYQQAGEAFGMSAEAVRQHARRLGWRRQPGNDGKTLILVPDDAAVRPRARPAGETAEQPPAQNAAQPPEQRPDEKERAVSYLAALAAKQQEENTVLLSQVVVLQADMRADREARTRAEERADRAEARADQAEIQLATVRQETEGERQARQVAEEARQKAERMLEEVQRALEEHRQAEAARKGRGRLAGALAGFLRRP